MRAAISAVAALVVVALPGGSFASGQALAFLEVRVGSLDAAVTLDPTGRLLDPNCPQNLCRFSYEPGTRVRLTALNTGTSQFVEWGGGCGGSTPVCELTVAGTRSVRASYNRLTLLYSATRGGEVRLLPGRSCGSGCVSYPFGTTDVEVTAVETDDQFTFDRWGENCAKVMSRGLHLPRRCA